jgi:hypothetical protein
VLADVAVIRPHDLHPHTPHWAAGVTRVLYTVDQSKALTIFRYCDLHIARGGGGALVVHQAREPLLAPSQGGVFMAPA